MAKFIISISLLGRVPDFLLTYAGLHPFPGPNIILSDSLLIKVVVCFCIKLGSYLKVCKKPAKPQFVMIKACLHSNWYADDDAGDIVVNDVLYIFTW